MNSRRSFVKSLGILGLGSLLVSSCKKLGLLRPKRFKGKVIVIGGGAAGVYATYLFKQQGIDVTLLEASDTIGGRLGKLLGFADYPIDLGAQWMHGRSSIVGEIVANGNVQVTIDDTEYSYWFQNQMLTSLPKDISIFEGEDLPDVSFAQYATDKGFSSDYQPIVESLAGDYGADANDLSVKMMNLEELNWSSGDGDYKFKETYFDTIISNFGNQIAALVKTQSIVNKIDYAQDLVTVTCSNGQVYTADKVLITVPITVLQSADIQFNPILPISKTIAFSKIGMGPGMKVFLKFSSKFFADNIYGGSVCAAYFNDDIGKVTNDFVLIAFVMGDQAASLSALPNDTAIVSLLMAELDLMYNGLATSNFVDAFVQDYSKKPFIRGAYSYSKIGIEETSRTTASQSIDNKLFFAGEAMNLNGHHQTVHGAIETGFREFSNIMELS